MHITVPIQFMHVISNIIERSKGGYPLTSVASRFNRNHTDTSSTTSGVVIDGDFNTSETTRRLIKVMCKQGNLEVISHSPNNVSPNKLGLMYRPCSWKCEGSTHSCINMTPNKLGLMYRPCSWKCEGSTHSRINMLWRLSCLRSHPNFSPNQLRHLEKLLLHR
jgi:hypothetical protein